MKRILTSTFALVLNARARQTCFAVPHRAVERTDGFEFGIARDIEDLR